MDYKFIYITTKDKEEAQQIGHELIKTQLAACINIYESMESIYWWEGEIVNDSEAVLIAKTSSQKVNDLIAKVKELHSYDTPSILVMNIENGNPDYFKWMDSSLE